MSRERLGINPALPGTPTPSAEPEEAARLVGVVPGSESGTAAPRRLREEGDGSDTDSDDDDDDLEAAKDVGWRGRRPDPSPEGTRGVELDDLLREEDEDEDEDEDEEDKEGGAGGEEVDVEAGAGRAGNTGIDTSRWAVRRGGDSENREPVSLSARQQEAAKGMGAGGHVYRRKLRKVKRVIDLYTYSPYFKKRKQLGLLRAGIAAYVWVSLLVSIPLWGTASQYMKGNLPCTDAEHTVGVFFMHPTFWNLLLCGAKLSVGASLCLRSRERRVRMALYVLEHSALPALLTYSAYFWAATKKLDDARARGVAVNNHVALPLLLVLETWFSKTPFHVERIWQAGVYLVWVASLAWVYSLAEEGCYLLPGLNPNRNAVWIAYPGMLMLYLGGFFVVYTFTQFRDHVAPCGQQIFPPTRYLAANS